MITFGIFTGAATCVDSGNIGDENAGMLGRGGKREGPDEDEVVGVLFEIRNGRCINFLVSRSLVREVVFNGSKLSWSEL